MGYCIADPVPFCPVKLTKDIYFLHFVNTYQETTHEHYLLIKKENGKFKKMKAYTVSIPLAC